jgi:hypothetical protein
MMQGLWRWWHGNVQIRRYGRYDLILIIIVQKNRYRGGGGTIGIRVSVVWLHI